MSYSNPLSYLAYGDWWDTFLPDFVLAFAFFTALIYMALGRRFGHQRPAIVVSAALGAALSAGLVWWEQVNDLSIRNLGPVAVGFAIIVLAGVMYQSIKGIGGSWAGAGIAFGASILVGWTLGIDWPVATEVMQTVAGAKSPPAAAQLRDEDSEGVRNRGRADSTRASEHRYHGDLR